MRGLRAAALVAAFVAVPVAVVGQKLTVPVAYHKLENRLKVVLSEDHSAPTAVVAIYYGIGFRIEPRERTGFAHLFEHMMFQGSQNLGKNRFIELAQTNVTDPSLKEIFFEIGRLRNEPPSAEELRGIQNYMVGTFALQASSRAGVLGLLRVLNLHGVPADFYANYVRRINALTPADVQRTARTYLDPQKMVIVIVGDRKAIAEQIAPFGTILP